MISTLLKLLKEGERYLKEHSVPCAKREAEDLLAHLLSLRRPELYLAAEFPISEETEKKYRFFLERRGKREPFGYIVGEVEFLGLSFFVSSGVLVPRQETEILASIIEKELKNEPCDGKVLLDIGTGSGCLAVSLKKLFPTLHVVAIDLSDDALALAKKNAERHGADVEFLKGDMFAPFKGRKADFLVVNPPYLSDEEWEVTEPEVKFYEPKMALSSGKTGLECYEKLKEQMGASLTPGARVFGEMGSLQKKSLSELFSKTKEIRKLRFEKDWAGLDRFFFLEIQSLFS